MAAHTDSNGLTVGPFEVVAVVIIRRRRAADSVQDFQRGQIAQSARVTAHDRGYLSGTAQLHRRTVVL